ncbi:2-polyprenylphenol 6-hydroxylase [Rhizobiaceae bacterium]|nr:2-polyprenylphenol 6-hydroxylase [Rhizobiaceae bacterium]
MATLPNLLRMGRALWVLMREGVVTALPAENEPPAVKRLKAVARLVERKRATDAPQSQNLARALNRLGPSWVKFGQFLATRPDLVGFSIARDLQLLQDRMDPFPEDEARAMIRATLGKPVSEVFATFGAPVAAASIAQVHRATVATPEGPRDVAVKVIRPGVREAFARDLQVSFTAARFVDRWFPAAKRLRLVESVEMLERSVRLEMEMRLEAAAFSEMADNTENDPDFRLPAIDWERSGRDCVTMDWVDGIKMNDVEAIRAAGHDMPGLARKIMQAFLRHALRDGFFHADMHPGNLFVAADGDIVAVDLGIAGRVTKAERRYLAEILFGFLNRDYRRVAEVHFEAGYVPLTQDPASFAQALRAVGEPIYGRTAEQISMGNMLTLLFEITDMFEMATRPELLLLQKTMVQVEGVARSLDPHFNMWEVAEPILRPEVVNLIGPKARFDEAREGLAALGQLARNAPELAQRAEMLSAEIAIMGRDGVRLDAPSIAAIGKAEARASRWGRVALWVIAAAAVWTAIQVS